jgi:hypothetical protein
MSEEEQDQMRKAIDDLQNQVAALHELVIALALALTEKPGAPLAEVAERMDFVRAAVRWRKGEPTAKAMGYVIDNLKAFDDLTLSPLVALALNALQYVQAGDRYRSALHTWLVQASPDEREHELLLVLQRIVAEASAPSGGDGSLDGS